MDGSQLAAEVDGSVMDAYTLLSADQQSFLVG